MTKETEESEIKPFILSNLLRGHSDDIKSLTINPNSNNLLYSASRDGTAKSWSKSTEGWKERETFIGHEGFVNCICWVEGHLITGGIDACINIYALQDDVPLSATPTLPINTLYGHSNNVCSLHTLGSKLASSSWDGTARIWSTTDWSLLYTIIPEGNRVVAIWDVLLLDGKGFEEKVLTASADGLIRLWNGGKLELIYKGHTSAVRSLVKITKEPSNSNGSEVGISLFASSSNDGSIRIWNLKGDSITVLDGHESDSFIYSLITFPTRSGDTGEIVNALASAGEEGKVRVWNPDDGDLDQEILVPALSVWTLASLPNGDLVIGCSDNLIWIFTRDPSRAASESITQEYKQALSARIKKKSTSTSAPTPLIESFSSLSIAGTKEGDIKLIKSDDEEDTGTRAYSWTNNKWLDLGEVIDQPSETNNPSSPLSPPLPPPKSTSSTGILFDHLFKIDISDTSPPLELGYNNNQDIEEVVGEFVERFGLSKRYEERILEFVRMGLGLGG